MYLDENSADLWVDESVAHLDESWAGCWALHWAEHWVFYLAVWWDVSLVEHLGAHSVAHLADL